MTFTLEILNQIGDVKDLLGNFLNEQVAKMDKPDLANAILKSFVSAKGTKKQLSVEEATESVQVFNPDAKAEQIRNYIVDFVNLRILRGEDDEGRYELRHDSLAAKIFEKISADEMELLEVRQFIENSLLNYKTRQIFLSTDDIAYIGNRENQLKLSKELKDFVDMSREHIRVKNRTVKRLTFLSAVALIIIILAIGKLVFETRLINDSIKLSYQSITQYKDIEKRITAARMAHEKNKRANSREALIKAFNELLENQTGNEKLDSISKIYTRNFEPAPEQIIYAECTNLNDNIFGYTANLIIIWENSGRIKHQFKHGKINILTGKISDDERFIALMNVDGVVTVYSTDGQNLYSKETYFTELNPKQAFGFTSSNLLVICNNSDIEIIDTHGNTLQTLSGHKAQVNALAISKNNRFIASASYDTTVRIWYFNKVRNLYSPYNTINWHKDTIWSVNFSSNEMCIITVSNDYSIVIGDINNVLITRYNTINRYCYADLLSDDLVLCLKKYWHNNSEVSYSYVADYIYRYYSPLKTQGIEEYQNLTFTEPLRYSAYSTENRTYLLDIEMWEEDFGNYLLYETQGEKPFFSMDGARMYNLDGKMINHHFISADSIYQIVK
jgi:WD40 repeat protein